jgi:hypothetical protein
MKPAMKLFKGRVPHILVCKRQSILYKNTKVPSFLPCSHVFLKMSLTVLELNDLNRKVMTREWTKRILVPYYNPFLNPLNRGRTYPTVMFITI